jgi:hypothetical protein
MSWLITPTQPIPAVIGEPFGGGYFAGYISHTADGNPTHALIVAPRATGATGTGYTLTTMLQWKTVNTTTAGATSPFDGAANTAAMVTAGIADHPAAQFCVNLSIGGFTDWYFPSLLELDIAYFNLKPTTTANVTTSGINAYAVPARASNYTTGNPAQTVVTAFTGIEAFEPSAGWSSTQGTANTGTGRRLWFANGTQDNFFKTVGRPVRAFRRITL